MFWTHIFDLLLKLAILFLNIICLISFLPKFQYHDIVCICLSILLSSIIYVYFLRTLGSYLYCKLVLKMNISFNEAKQLNPSLAPYPFNLTRFEWLPFTEIKSIPKEKRFHQMLQIQNDWQNNKKQEYIQQKNNFLNANTTLKVIQYLIWTLVGVFFITSYLQVPPAIYIINLYCTILDTNEYSPMFIGSILTLLLTPIHLYIQKRINDK